MMPIDTGSADTKLLGTQTNLSIRQAQCERVDG